MNLYIEASKVLNAVRQQRSAVKTLVYSSQYDNKKQLLALVCETLRFGSVLSKVVDSLNLLKTERLLKNDASLAQALLYDFTIGKGLVRAGRLKQTMTRNKTEIQKTCQQIMEEAGVQSLAELLPEEGQDVSLPRYVRVNLIKTTVESVIATLESEDWEYVASPATSMKRFRKTVKDLEKYQFTRDLHLSDVLVFPPGTDFHDNQLLLSGEIILQDKASCFPAHVLDPPEGAVVVDCCAAPGNKTSHLASLMKNNGQIIAFDKDGRRMATLQNLTKMAGVTCVTTRCQDFLRVNPEDSTYSDVEYLLVDPSCSGSGIVSRMNQFTDDDDSSATDRLESLARFQMLILEHALRFPNVKKVVYSTCSVHTEENEAVVENVYQKVKDKFEFLHIMSDWPNRGADGYDHAQDFIRMSPEISLTNGFFIACFQKLTICHAEEKIKTKDLNKNVDKNEECHVEEPHEKSKKREKSKIDFDENSESIAQKSKKKEQPNSIYENEEVNIEEMNDNVSHKKHKKSKTKKTKESEIETECLSEPDSKEHKKSKHKKSETKNTKESEIEIECLSEPDSKKHKKSKHKKTKNTKIDTEPQDKTETRDYNEETVIKREKKHKRKHENVDNATVNGESPPHKKHKHKKKKKD